MRAVVTRPHWSYSSVSQYLRCPLQFYFERVLKRPRRTTTAAQVLGSAVHAALAAYHRKLQSGEPVTAQQVHRAYLAAWDDQAHGGRVVDPGDKTIDDCRDLGLALVDTYLDGPPPDAIIAVEAPILAPLADSHGECLERPILVVPDLITREADDTLKVTEIKTAGRSFSESEVATSLQPTFYANALYEQTGREPAVEYAVLVKTKTPKLQRIESFRTSSDFQRLGDLIGVVDRAVEAGIFYPQESPMNCSGCPYFRECREWSGVGVSNSGPHDEPVAEESAPC